jgi:putative ABC transport system permease protein
MDSLPPATSPPSSSSFEYDPTWESVAWGLAILLLNGLLSVVLELGLHGQLFGAATRMVIQLSCLGLILTPIFEANSWPIVLGYAMFMNFFAVLEATSRGGFYYRGQFLHTMICMSVSSFLILFYAIFVVVKAKPWFEASYAIPTLGMILGNCTSGVSLGVSTILAELREGKDRIEWQLALGATRWEALKASLSKAMTAATMPLLNSMSVLGLVAIPGMMTGQILAGSDPLSAARSQIIIMCLVGGASCFSSTLAIYFAASTIVDERFRSDLLLSRKPSSGPSVFGKIKALITALFRCCCCCCFYQARGADNEGQEEGVHAPLMNPGLSPQRDARS